ncbi:MAG: transcription antitermination factor NusB [Steroidobacteraceae bacterium]
MSSPPKFNRASAARSAARKLALQALYSWQINPLPWQDLLQQFGSGEEAVGADREYLRELLEAICSDQGGVEARIAEWADLGRPLDPIEKAALLIGVHELQARLEVPFRVAISESVALARKFGATDGHKFVNAVLDRAARTLRPHEH